MEATIDARSRRPAAVIVLQVFGAALLAVSVIPLAIGAIAGVDDLGRYALLAFFPALAGLCALAAGWRRPLGLVFGMLSLSLMLVTLVGAIFVAVVGFLGVRDRDQVRDYYTPGTGR